MIVDRPGQLIVDVVAPGRRTLALTERFHAGWSAVSGDVSLETVTVDHDFLGCIVEAGAHRVTFHFMPRSFVYGSLASAIGIALLAGVLVIGLTTRAPATATRTILVGDSHSQDQGDSPQSDQTGAGEKRGNREPRTAIGDRGSRIPNPGSRLLFALCPMTRITFTFETSPRNL